MPEIQKFLEAQLNREEGRREGALDAEAHGREKCGRGVASRRQMKRV
jgi:hypothetical protein